MVSKVDNRRSGEPTLSMAAVDWTKTTSTKWEVAFSSNTLSFPYVFTTHKCTGLLQGLYVSNPCFPNQHVVRLTRRVVGQFVFLAVNAQYQATPNVRYYLTFWVNLIFLVTRIIRCTPTSLQLGISGVRLRVYMCTSKKVIIPEIPKRKKSTKK